MLAHFIQHATAGEPVDMGSGTHPEKFVRDVLGKLALEVVHILLRLQRR